MNTPQPRPRPRSPLRRTAIWGCALTLALSAAACGDEAGDDGDADAGQGDPDGCTARVAADATQQDIQRTFIEAGADIVICIEAGTYALTDELSISARGVTLRGLGDERPLLDFSGQQTGANGILVTGDDFTVENLRILDSPGDGIRVEGTDNAVFRNLHVSWSADGSPDNGAYAVYPVNVDGVLIEDSEVIGASDAGIYVGQSENCVVRRNYVHGNVAGIEIENSSNCEVYDNHAYDNTAGILVFNLPNLPVQGGERTRVFDNLVEGNNRANFAAAGNIVASVPKGTGVLVLAADSTELHGNTIRDNGSVGVLVVSWPTFALIGGGVADDPNYDQYAETTWLHENTYADNGAEPDSLLVTLGLEEGADVMWDGFVNTERDNSDESLSLCIREPEGTSFLDVNGPESFNDPKDDIGAHDCEHGSLPPLGIYEEE